MSYVGFIPAEAREDLKIEFGAFRDFIESIIGFYHEIIEYGMQNNYAVKPPYQLQKINPVSGVTEIETASYLPNYSDTTQYMDFSSLSSNIGSANYIDSTDVVGTPTYSNSTYNFPRGLGSGFYNFLNIINDPRDLFINGAEIFDRDQVNYHIPTRQQFLNDNISLINNFSKGHLIKYDDVFNFADKIGEWLAYAVYFCYDPYNDDFYSQQQMSLFSYNPNEFSYSDPDSGYDENNIPDDPSFEE